MWKRQLIVSVLWLAAVGWYWRGSVPLLPTRSAELKYDSTIVGWTPNGEAVVCRPQMDSSGLWWNGYGGPVSVWRVPDLQKVSERLGYGDTIELGHFDLANGIAVVGGGSPQRVVDLSTGVTLEDVPKDVRVVVRSGAGQGLLYLRDDRITLRDPRSSRDIWTNNGLSARQASFDGGLVTLYGVTRLQDGTSTPNPRSRECLLLNGRTGEVDTRFDAVRPFDSLVFTKDERWALVRQYAGMQHLCDGRTGQRLWTLTVKFQNWPHFDAEKDELVLHWATKNGKFHESKWRCSDGAELSPPPVEFGWAHRVKDSSGRYAIEVTEARGWYELFCARCVNPLLRELGSKRQLPFERSIRVLRDLSTGEEIGPLPADRAIQFIPGGSAAVAVGGRRIDVFEFPAGRDWMWLVWWGVVPVSVAWGGRGLWWVFRRRFREAGPRQRPTGG